VGMKRVWTKTRKLVVDSWLVFVSRMFEVRHMWVWSVVMISFFPLSIMGFLLLFGESTPERILYIVTGSITNAVSLQAGLSLGQRIGSMKAHRVFDYYASLPISKLSFIFGLNLNALLLCVPSSLILLTISMLAFRLRIVNQLSSLRRSCSGGSLWLGWGQ